MAHQIRSSIVTGFTGAVAAVLISAGAAQASVTIAAGATKNMNCSAGVCSPTAKKAVLNVNDLTNMLTSGDVKITTGAGAVTITIAAPFSWTSTSRLTLDAYYNVSFKAPVMVAGQGAVTITYNDGGSGGDLIFFPGAKLDFWDTSSSLIINQTSFALVDSIATLKEAAQANRAGTYAFANDYDAAPDGTLAHAPMRLFEGTFEGLGHAISNLSISTGGEAGFFNTLMSTGIARDINLVNATVVCTKTHKHILAGLLAGQNYGLIAHASVSGTVRSVPRSINHFVNIGGLIGFNAGTITSSSAWATVTFPANKVYIGGLVGYSAGPILNSYAGGSVSTKAGAFAGGLAGRASMIANSYATSSVTTKHKPNAGGLVGLYEGGTIGSSYSTGKMYSAARPNVGGFVGVSKATTSDGYWDTDTSGTNIGCGAGNCTGVTGLTDTKLKTRLPRGFDPAVWGQSPSINNGYPYLLANPPPQ